MTLPADDVIAIQQLLARYPHAVDANDGDEVADMFVANGRFIYPGVEPIEGAAEIREFVKGLSSLGSLRHVVTSPLIDGDAEEAWCRSYCHVFGLSKKGKSRVVSQGIYHDTLVKIDGWWRFEERRYVTDVTGPKG